MSPPIRTEQALAAALSAEHAAIYAYGPIGVRLDRRRAADEARAAEAAHRARRDALVAAAHRRRRHGAAGPRPGTRCRSRSPTRPSALRLAVEVEERTAAVWRAALPATTGAAAAPRRWPR